MRRPGWPHARPIRLGVLVGALLLVSPPAWATGLNVEQVRIRPDDDGAHGTVQVGVDFQAGNTNLLDISASAALGFRHGRHVAFLVGNSKYSTRTRAADGEDLGTLLAPDSRFVNKANLHLRYNYEVLEWLVPELFGQIERDEFLLVESRVLLGVGPRFLPFDNDEFTVAIGSDYMLEYESLDPTLVVRPLPAQTLVHRWSSYLSLNLRANDRLRMSSTTYVQPRFDRFSDLRLMSAANLEVTLVEQLSLRLGLRIRWDNAPAVYCRSKIEIDGCPIASEIQLRELDVAVENSLMLRF